MTAAAAASVALWIYCGAMSVWVRRHPPFLQASLVQVASVALYVALVGTAAMAWVRTGHPLITMTSMALVLVVGVLLGFRYFAFLLHEMFDHAHAGALSVEHMKVEKTYDRAEKAEHEGRLEEALELYREEAARDPSDPEARRRMGEIHLRRGETNEALDRFRAALPLIESAEARTTLAFRTSDLLAREGRPAEARELLDEVVRLFPNTRFADYARRRMSSL